MRTVLHQFQQKEFYHPTWNLRYLFLGTFNPLGGEEVNYYYGRKQNQAWRILSQLFGKDFDVSHFHDFNKKLLADGVACMDLIHSVTAPEVMLNQILGKGYSDSKIINTSVNRQYNTERILRVINANKDVRVYSTWGKGPSLKEWRTEVAKILKVTSIIPLVSPSMIARVPKG